MDDRLTRVEEQLDADREHMAELTQSIQDLHNAQREQDRMTKENFVRWLDSAHKLKEQTEHIHRVTINEFTKFPDHLALHENVIRNIMRNSAEETFAPLLNDAAVTLQDSMRIVHAMDKLVIALEKKTQDIELDLAQLHADDRILKEKLDILFNVTRGHDAYLGTSTTRSGQPRGKPSRAPS